MMAENLPDILQDWIKEITIEIEHSDSYCIAIFKDDGELVYANEFMSSFFVGNPGESLINPSFEKIIKTGSDNSLIYEGFLTMGSYYSENKSIKSRIFRKNDQILIIGNVDSNQLVEQNKIMINLNHDINNLQRQLIKEKRTLESTLEQLNKTNIDLAEANATKDKFFSILAHDLRNPFNILLGFSGLLLENFRDYNQEDIETQLLFINKTAQDTFNLLEDLLLWSKSQSNRINYKPENLKFRDICDEIITNLNPMIKNKNIEVEINELSDITLFADSNMLKTILRNLVSNAIKFSYPNSKIILKIEKPEGKAIITVSDNGVGIPETIQSRLWKISEHITTQGTNKESGTGLGLLLCKDFVEKHDCTIWVESETGKGSDFKFTMPVAQHV